MLTPIAPLPDRNDLATTNFIPELFTQSTVDNFNALNSTDPASGASMIGVYSATLAGSGQDVLSVMESLKENTPNFVRFATQGEAEAGTSELYNMNPKNVKDSIVANVVYATTAEATGGVVTDKVMSPKTTDDAITSALSSFAGTSLGGILEYPDATPPEGFLICGGQAVSRTTYSDLFDLFGTKFGEGDASTTFNMPLIGPAVLGSTPTYAVDLNGTNQYCSGAATGISNNNFSFGIWINADSVASGTLIELRYDFTYSNLWVDFESGKIRVFLANNATLIKSYATTSSLSIDTDYLIGVSWNGTTLNIHVNGVLQSVTKPTDISGTPNIETSSLRLGAAQGGASNWFNGRIAACYAWNDFITTAEFLSIYNNGVGVRLDLNSNIFDYTSGSTLEHQWRINNNTDISGEDTGKSANLQDLTFVQSPPYTTYLNALNAEIFSIMKY